MTPEEMEKRIIRYGDLQPCRSAFIDAHTPGSDKKENFTVIGGGVSESPEQHIHLKDKIGFNIGAAGQPPYCKNSLHSHHTAEVFYVLQGRWRFFWGRFGDAGEVILEEGDIFNIPTGIFRGFENIGTDYGMLMAILGGDDAGGGVVWAPQVLDDAKAHGLILGENGKLVDTKKGESLPENIKSMAPLSAEELQKFPEVGVEVVVGGYVARYLDLLALSKKAPCKVIGKDGLLRDDPGFEVEFFSRDSLQTASYKVKQHEVLMIMRGHWRLVWQGGEEILAPGDTCALVPGLDVSFSPSMSGEAGLYRVLKTNAPAGPTTIFT